MSASAKNPFLKWLLEKRDVDGLVIALLITNALTEFTEAFGSALLEPIAAAVLPTNEDDEQILKVGNREIKFKLQHLLSGFIKVSINIAAAYFIVVYVYKKLLKIKN
jgi:large-conductance mechanosensitive channel